MSKVTVITATVGNPRLHDNLASVAAQDHEDVEHLVFVDGPERYEKVQEEIEKASLPPGNSLNLIKLPYPVGTNGWNGHRMYAAGAFLADGDFVMWLDDDNFLEPNHVSSLLETVKENKLDWAYSFRNIVDKDGKFYCQDNCESLGKWASVLGEKDFFIDVNCYFIPKGIAVHLGPAWYRRFRVPGQPEVDRVLSASLMQNGLKFDTTYRYTVNYTVGNTQNSVQKEFFDRGNKEMRRRHPDGLPWKVMELPL